MPDTHDDFRDLMRQVRAGSEEAAWELVDRYGEAIRRAVRRTLNKKMRSKFDSLDFVQLVWSSFFRARGQLDRFEHPGELAAFLMKVASNKVGMEVRRRLLTEKYNLNREYSLDELGIENSEDTSDRQPAPIDLAIAREQLERMLQDQPQHYRKIIQLRLQGHTNREIAGSLQLDESTVRRFLKRLFREIVV